MATLFPFPDRSTIYLTGTDSYGTPEEAGLIDRHNRREERMMPFPDLLHGLACDGQSSGASSPTTPSPAATSRRTSSSPRQRCGICASRDCAPFLPPPPPPTYRPATRRPSPPSSSPPPPGEIAARKAKRADLKRRYAQNLQVNKRLCLNIVKRHRYF